MGQAHIISNIILPAAGEIIKPTLTVLKSHLTYLVAVLSYASLADTYGKL